MDSDPEAPDYGHLHVGDEGIFAVPILNDLGTRCFAVRLLEHYRTINGLRFPTEPDFAPSRTHDLFSLKSNE